MSELPSAPHAAVVASEEELDSALQRAAKKALGGREGTVLVIDPQTGRLRAVANSRLAFAEAFPPGSAIKPFTLLAALRAELIDGESRLLCLEKYSRAGYSTHCSHPRFKPPFNPAQALAYSCNYYFSKLGERLNEKEFNGTLTSFGFGARTGAGDELEATGLLPHGSWHVNTALGDDTQFLVTPVQLLTAYTALVNGGHLYVPQYVPARNFTPQERARLDIAPEHRALLLKGMRGAVAYGTAARAGLDALPPYIYGKTGTSTSDEDFHMHGWFIGFAAERNPAAQSLPESARLAVLVFLKHAHGAECAEAARPVFDAYTRHQAEQANEPTSTPGATVDADAAHAPNTLAESVVSHVRVHLTREDRTQTLPLDDYVFGVLAAEGSVENEFEALKAQAVISRTYALKNAGRHARDGYDVCDSTHCQRYLFVRDESVRADFYALLHRAVRETTGEVLLDRQGRIAEAYFSAACGGMTANINSLWGTPAPVYLRGLRDEYCAGGPYHHWTDTIPLVQLLRALRADHRTDVGDRLDGIRVVKRDATGRAELLSLEGERRRLVRGWDFKIIVGRTLGWNVLKSTRFEVTRAGAAFLFHGSGFGHGLGLCQSGAHVMAERGAPYRQILDHYFPGTNVGHNAESGPRSVAAGQPRLEMKTNVRERMTGWRNLNVRAPAAQEAWRADVLLRRSDPRPQLSESLARASSQAIRGDAAQRGRINGPAGSRTSHARLTLSSESFRVTYSSRFERREVELALHTLEEAKADVLHRLSAASVNISGLAPLDVLIHDTTGDFVGATGQPPWAAGATRGRRIELQPLDVLRRRGVLATTLRHEYAHAVIETLGHGRTPRWLAEGLAAYFAGEGPMLVRSGPKIRPERDELERKLARPASPQEMRALYAAAYREVSALIQSEGESSVWKRVAAS